MKKLVRALKPGGILAVQDYYRETLSMVPRPEEWTRFILADLAFFAMLIAGSPMLAQRALPAGVVRVSFGVADRTTNSAGTETCRIPKPLSTPATFERGVTEITYAVQLEPKVVKTAGAQLTAPTGQGTLTAITCNVFTLVPGGFSQTQLGNTVSRTDKKPLASGSYNVRITVDGQSVDVPFIVK